MRAAPATPPDVVPLARTRSPGPITWLGRTDMPLAAAAVQEVIAVIRMETRTPGSSTPSLAT